MAGWAQYDDCGEVYELSALYDDTLKKNETFINFAVKVAQEIAGRNAKITWGKWGARIELSENKRRTRQQLESVAYMIERHPSWLALKLATHVFTYGRDGISKPPKFT